MVSGLPPLLGKLVVRMLRASVVLTGKSDLLSHPLCSCRLHVTGDPWRSPADPRSQSILDLRDGPGPDQVAVEAGLDELVEIFGVDLFRELLALDVGFQSDPGG
jgi:hypothetical protein